MSKTTRSIPHNKLKNRNGLKKNNIKKTKVTKYKVNFRDLIYN